MPKDAPIGELTNSRSQILEYLRCGYRWELGYKRGIAPAGIREALDQGSAVHRAVREGIAGYVSAPKKFNEKALRSNLLKGADIWAKEARAERGKYLNDQSREEIEVLRRDSVGIAFKAMEYIKIQDWEVAVVGGIALFEVELLVPMPPWKGFRTIPDLVARPRSEGKNAPYWLMDWKTRGSFETDDAEEVNLQFASMQHVMALKYPKVEIDGSMLWQIKDAEPKEPKLNKDGKMSRADIVSDWPTYSGALMKAGLDPKDYADMKEKLDAKEWYRVIKQHRSPEEAESVWNQIVVPASSAMARNPQVIRNWNHIPFGCKGCWARQFCLTELRDEDTEFLLQTDFMDTRRPRKRMEMGEPVRTFKLT